MPDVLSVLVSTPARAMVKDAKVSLNDPTGKFPNVAAKLPSASGVV